MIDPSESQLPSLSATPPAGGNPWRARLKRWGPYAGTGLAMLLLGLLLGATLFGGDPEPAAALPCKEAVGEPELIEATATPPDKAPVRKKSSGSRPRSAGSSDSEGGHF
jgi:hypothetical protein